MRNLSLAGIRETLTVPPPDGRYSPSSNRNSKPQLNVPIGGGGGGGGGPSLVELDPPWGPSSAYIAVGIANASTAIRQILDTISLSFFIGNLLLLLPR